MKETKILILAAKNDSKKNQKFFEETGTYRHLVKIEDEPIIHRTQRILNENGYKNITVFCDKGFEDQYAINNNKTSLPPDQLGEKHQMVLYYYRDSIINKNIDTIVLYGDVYYSEETLIKILNDKSDFLKLYGRSKNTSLLDKNYSELYAWKFNREDAKRLMKIAEEARFYVDQMRRLPILAHYLLFAKFSGYEELPLSPKKFEGKTKHWIEVEENITDDVDSPADNKLFKVKYRHEPK